MSQVPVCQRSPSEADNSEPSLGGDNESQHRSNASHRPTDISNEAIDLTDESLDEGNFHDETWTQIPGASDVDMSDSDDCSVDTSFQYQTPNAIRKAEKDVKHQPLDPYTTTDVHARYRDFASLLCTETATDDAHRHVMEGLSIATDTAGSIQLNDNTTHDDELDVYALALVVHVWQIVCLRMQHGILPPADTEVSLCLSLTAYFLSAHAMVRNYCTVSPEELRYAVQYWEDRLRLMGGGNRWMEDRWAKNVPHVHQDIGSHRNETATRYLEALEKFGKEGLTISIIEQEGRGKCTQLRTMVQSSPDAMRQVRRQIASMLYSMDTSLLKAMIQGQLPRLAEIGSGPVYEALQELNGRDYIQPGTYMNCICDFVGLSPTPYQWQRVCEQMLKYVQYGNEHNVLAQQIDHQIHPKPEWPKELAHKGLRRYTEWRSYMEKGTYTPDVVHRWWVRYFVDQLQKRMEGHSIHAPLNVPVVEIGFSNDPRKRLRQHRHHESSNYLMNLAEAVFTREYPGCFQLQQRIVFACYRPIQTWLSEIIVTQLAQGYVEGGAGFSHEPAGSSNTSSNSKVPGEIWAQFEAQIYEDGRFEMEVEANRQSLQRGKDAEAEEEEQRKKEAEARRRLHAARVKCLKDMIAVEEARKNLADALIRRL